LQKYRSLYEFCDDDADKDGCKPLLLNPLISL